MSPLSSPRAATRRHRGARRLIEQYDRLPFLETTKVFDMLLALPRHGRVKATKILHSCRVSPSTTFGGLSERQRTELAGHFDR
jgi:hypothetical protein